MPGLLDLFYGLGEGRHEGQKAEARREQAERVARKKAYGHLARPSTYGSPQFGRSSDTDISLIRSLLTYLTGDAPYADTNSRIFNQWAHHNKDLKHYSLSDDGTLYYNSRKVDAHILKKDDTNNDELIDILALLAQANQDKYKAGRSAEAVKLGEVSYQYKGAKSGSWKTGSRHEQEGINPWDDILEYFDPKHTSPRGAYIHIDTRGGTFDMGPKDYIMAKRSMGILHGRSANSFARAINKNADLYYDVKNGRLLYKNVDADYLPFDIKETLGELIYKEVFEGRNAWKRGDPYGWYNLGAGDDHKFTKPPQRTPKPKQEPTDEPQDPSAPGDDGRRGYAPSAEPTASKKGSGVDQGPDSWELGVVAAIDEGRTDKEKKEILAELNSGLKSAVVVGTSAGVRRAKYFKIYVTLHELVVKEMLLKAARAARTKIMDGNDKKDHELRESERKASESRHEASVSLAESKRKAEESKKAYDISLSESRAADSSSKAALALSKALEDARRTAEATVAREKALLEASQKKESSRASALQHQTDLRLTQEATKLAKSLALSQERHDKDVALSNSKASQVLSQALEDARLTAERQLSELRESAAKDSRRVSDLQHQTDLRLTEEATQRANALAESQRLYDSSISESKRIHDSSVALSESERDSIASQTALRIAELEATIAAGLAQASAENSSISAATAERIQSEISELTKLREESESKESQSILDATKSREDSVSASQESESKSISEATKKREQELSESQERDSRATAEASRKRDVELSESEIKEQAEKKAALLRLQHSLQASRSQETATPSKSLDFSDLVVSSPLETISQSESPKQAAAEASTQGPAGSAPSVEKTIAAVVKTLESTPSAAPTKEKTEFELLTEELKKLSAKEREAFIKWADESPLWGKIPRPIRADNAGLWRQGLAAWVQFGKPHASTPTPTPKMPKAYLDLKKYYNDGLTFEQKLEFGKWLNATLPDLYPKLFADNITEVNAAVMVEAVKQWKKAQPGVFSKIGDALRAAGRGVGAVGGFVGDVAAAPFVFVFDAGRWVVNKTSGLVSSEGKPTKEPTPKPTPKPATSPPKTAYTIPAAMAESLAADAAKRQAAKGRTPAAVQVGGTQGTQATTLAPTSVFKSSAAGTQATKAAPTSASAPATSRQATTAGPTGTPIPKTVPDYVKEVLETAEAGQRPRTEGRQEGATSLGLAGQTIKGPSRQAPRIAGSYTKSQFEKGVTSRLVNTQNSLDAVKVISDNLLSIYPDSSFYIYSRKMSSNLFKHEGYRFANSGLEKFKPGTAQEDKGWTKVENEELLKLATDNPELFRKIADWSTILSAANYAQDQNMPQVYEGLLTAHPHLLELIKRANLDQEIKTRISFNVGASRLTIEPKVVTDFRKMLAGMSEADRRFLKNEGIHGRFPLIITNKGELLFAQDVEKLKKAVPLHKLEPQALKAAMGSVMRYLEANNIAYTLPDDKDATWDRIDPSKFQEDPNAEPDENEDFMKNRPVLHIPRDKKYPELMPRPEPPLRSKEEDEAYNIERSQSAEQLRDVGVQELLGKVNSVLKENLFGSGDETRKWFEMKGIPGITLNGEGELIGSVHGHGSPAIALLKALQPDGNTGKTYVEEFADWVKGLKKQDNRSDDIPHDLAHIEDLLAGHGEDLHHTSFGGNFLNHPNISQSQNDASLFPKFKPKYGRAMEIYNEKNQFNINPNYWKHFIYTSQLTRNDRRETKGEEVLGNLRTRIARLFEDNPDVAQKMLEHVSNTDLKRHVRLSHQGSGDLKPLLRDDAPPFAVADIEDVTNDIGGIINGYPQAKKDELIKSIGRMGLSLNDVGKFVEDHPELVKTPIDAGLRKMGDGIYEYYTINDSPKAPDLLKDTLAIIGNYYANTVPEKLRAAGIKLNFDDPSNFAAGAINSLYDNYKKRTHAGKESTLWQKNYAARRAERMFDAANITTTSDGSPYNWRNALGTPMENFKLDTDFLKNGTVTNAGWTFINKFMEPLLSQRAGHSSELVFNGENVRAGMKKHARKDTNTRLISDSSSAKLKQGIAAFEVFKRQIVGIAKDTGVNLSELRDENNTLSMDATDKAFRNNPEAMRRLNQLKEAFSIELSPNALNTLYGTANGELRRERQLMGTSPEFDKYYSMSDDDIEKLPWEEAVLATYIKSMSKQGIRPESTFFDFLLHHFKRTQTERIKGMIKNNDVKGLIDSFSVWFRDQKGQNADVWAQVKKEYEAWLKATGKEREYFGEKGKRVPGEPQKQAEPVKPTTVPKVEPTPPPAKPGFETTKTTVKPPVTPSPTPMPQAPPHPATPAPMNMNSPMGQSMVNAAQPWQMGQQNANLGGMPNPNIAGSMGFNATAGQQRPPMPNMGAPTPQPTPIPQPTPGPNPFTADRQTFTPPQAGSANMGTASANAQKEAEAIRRAFEESNTKRSSKQGDDEVREETTSPEWISDAAKEGAPSGTNEKLWKLINWLKNKSLENIEDQHRLINQGSAGRAMLKGAVDLAKGRPWYYDYVSEKKQEPKIKR